MPTATPTRQRPSPSPSPSGSRSATATALEVLYNTAVQAFIRRDHPTAISSLHKLLDQLTSRPAPSSTWYDLTSSALSGQDKDLAEWREKVLKLYISSTVSLYSDPKGVASAAAQTDIDLGEDIPRLLPPAAPDVLLTHLQRTAELHSLPLGSKPPILPPSLISTLLLASLKLSPATPALDFAHRLAEDWLAALPDSLVEAISRASGKADGASAEQKKRVEGLTEGYLKVTELFVGEVLVKEGEWEMARAFLEGEGVMGSKRKENLYRHIRTAESRPKSRSNPSSPSSSVTLPSPSSSGTLPSKSPSSSSQPGRSRSSSASSSSSEATARPNGTSDRLNVPARRSVRGRDRLLGKSASRGLNGKQKAEEADDEKDASTSTKSSMPSKLYVDHSPASSARVPLRPRIPTSPRSPTGIHRASKASWESLIVLLPKSAQGRVRSIVSNPWLLAAISIPIPLLFLITLFLGIRRRILKKRNELVGKAAGKLVEVAVTAGQSRMAVDAMADVRARLGRARENGLRQWISVWLRWWLGKLGGIWKMATIITYL